MAYHLRLSNISRNFSLEDGAEVLWTIDVDSPEEFARILNRVAIATSGTERPVVDFPEVEVTVGTRRAVITSIGGELYYTDPRSPNRQNLKVVPEEALRLLDNLPLEQVFGSGPTEEEEDAAPRARYKGAPGRGRFRRALLAGLFVITMVCLYTVWDTLSYEPRLYVKPDFSPAPRDRGEALLAEWTGVYVSEYREGGRVFELERDGRFEMFELWHSAEESGFRLYPVQRTAAVPGTTDGEPVFLIDGAHLLKPLADDRMELHGVPFERHFGSIGQLGEIAESP